MMNITAATNKKRIQRQRNKFEQRREAMLQNLQSVPTGIVDTKSRSSFTAPESGNAPPPGQGSSPAQRKESLLEYQEQSDTTVRRLKSVLNDAAKKAANQSSKAFNPAKPSLTDVARMYLQDVGEELSGRPLMPSETVFVEEAHTTGTYVQKLRDMYKDVERTIRKRVENIETRRKQQEGVAPMEAEHMTFTEYQKYMRKRGYLRDDKEDVPEGNLIPILAVLQGQAESVGFMKSQRKLVRIGDFVVELDPNDPMFARYDDDAEMKAEQERRRQFQLYRNGKFKDGVVQTDPRDDDATDAEIAHVYHRLEEAQNVIEAMDKSKLEAELFVETALSRVVGMRQTVTRMYDTMETGHATLSRLTAEAMAQNERLWKKLEAIALDQADEKAKKSINRTFTYQIDRLHRLVSSLKLRMEDAENAQMQLCDDYHYQETVHVKKMDDLRKQVIPKLVKDELNALHQQAEVIAREEPGGFLARETKSKLETSVDLMMHADAANKAPTKGAPAGAAAVNDGFDLTLPSNFWSKFNFASDSAFGSFDEICKQTMKVVYDMMMNPHHPQLVAERVKEVRELAKEIRHSVQHVVNDLVTFQLESYFTLQREQQSTVRRLETEIARLTQTHVAEMEKQREELTKQFQQTMSGSISFEQLEKEKQKAVAKEREKFQSQIGKDVAIPPLSIPTTSTPFVIPQALLLPSAQPQDLLHTAQTYLTEMTMEMCQLCTRTGQAPPPRLAGVKVALQLLKLAQDKVTTNEGLVDGIAAKLVNGMDAVLPSPYVGNVGAAPSPKSGALSEAVDITEKWWTAAGGGVQLPTSPSHSLRRDASTPTTQSQQHQQQQEDTLIKKGLEQAASLLNGAHHLSETNLCIRSRLAEVVKAPESVIAATLEVAKEKASELRTAGIIRPKLVEGGDDALAGSFRKKKTATGKKQPGGGKDNDAASSEGVGSPLITVPSATVRTTVDRATSPMTKFKSTSDSPIRASKGGVATGGNRSQMEAKLSERIRSEIITALHTPFRELHAVLEYLRISLSSSLEVDTIDEGNDRTPQLLTDISSGLTSSGSSAILEVFSEQLKTDRTRVERLTAMLLSASAEEALHAARVRYTELSQKLLVKSKLSMFASQGQDKGISCNLIGGKEAILTSNEAIDYAIHHDMRIISNTRKGWGAAKRQEQQHQSILRNAVPEEDTSLLMAQHQSEGDGGKGFSLPPIKTPLKGKDAGGGGGDVSASVDLISVRRLVHNHMTSQTPPPSYRGPSMQSRLGETPSQYAYRHGKELEEAWMNM